MRAYVDCVLALLPFEPAAHARLGGPRCVYVGHPLVERLAELRPNAAEARRRSADPPLVLVLPGSRRSVAARLMADFGARDRAAESIARPVRRRSADPAPYRGRSADSWPRCGRVRRASSWGKRKSSPPSARARAALAASGTATLELALAGVPLVGAYKVSPLEAQVRHIVTLPFSILLPNLVLGERAIPEFLQRDCNPPTLAAALAELTREGPARAAQRAALDALDARMRLADGRTPSAHAATAVLETIADRASARADRDGPL